MLLLSLQSDMHKREKELVKEAAAFLVVQQIPAFVSSVLIPRHVLMFVLE